LPLVKDKKIGLNRAIKNQKLYISFKNPWNYLMNLTAEARAAGEGKAKHSSNSLWWRLLKKVRTYYQENPDTDEF